MKRWNKKKLTVLYFVFHFNFETMWAGLSPCLNLTVSQNTAQVFYFVSFVFMNLHSHNSRKNVTRCKENLQVDCSVHVAHFARTVYQNTEEPLAYLTTFRTTSNQRCTHLHLAGLLTFALGWPRNLIFFIQRVLCWKPYHTYFTFSDWAPGSLRFSLEHSLKSVRLLTIRIKLADKIVSPKWTSLSNSDNNEEELNYRSNLITQMLFELVW